MSKVKMTEQKDIDKIIIQFKDGTVKEVNKGMIISLQSKENDELTMNIECCNVNGEDYQNVMYGLLSLAAETYQEEEI